MGHLPIKCYLPHIEFVRERWESQLVASRMPESMKFISSSILSSVRASWYPSWCLSGWGENICITWNFHLFCGLDLVLNSKDCRPVLLFFIWAVFDFRYRLFIFNSTRCSMIYNSSWWHTTRHYWVFDGCECIFFIIIVFNEADLFYWLFFMFCMERPLIYLVSECICV